MLTHDNDNFPSDVFTIMEAIGATVTIGMILILILIGFSLTDL